MKQVYVVLLISTFSIGQNIEIFHEDGEFIMDENIKLIVSNVNINSYQDLQSFDSLKVNLNNAKYTFIVVPKKLEYGPQYLVHLNSVIYKLYFSKMPLINIYVSDTIADDPKTQGLLILSDTIDAELVTSYCGIEFRGGYTQSFPKKSYDIELWEDKDGHHNNDETLLNMRDDDDWILIGMYNEPLRLRNVVSHEIWSKIHIPYYIKEEEEAKAGINTQYVELAINNEYLGVYALCEQVDRKQLKLAEFTTSMRGELYKAFTWGTPTYSDLPPFNNAENTWGGFELKYPKATDYIDWENLYDWIDFVMYSENTDFQKSIEDKFVINNAADYFILINLIQAKDNTGKNTFIAKYKEDEPYFYVPWDLDGVLGNSYTGEESDKYDDILLNFLYERLLDPNNGLFNSQLANRWFELRNSLLNEAELISLIEKNYLRLLVNGNYEREALKWSNKAINISNLNYTYTWLYSRIQFLDDYFSSNIFTNVSSPNRLEKTIDILGRETNSNQGFQLHIYDDGSVEKKYLVK